ncbi:G1-specific transcriptional repressor WHI5 [Microdochium nivale]|nr:G1-specific transcriptional repressor WHI5 [Microdochium nivale]
MSPDTATTAGHGPPHHDSSTESQSTTATNDTDRVFTPPGSDSGHSSGNAPAGPSSQDSQLFHLSELAAARDKIPEADEYTAISRKRTSDGTVKHKRNNSLVSPRKIGHSRNTSTVSMASTGSRIGELSAELRAKLSYAMVKVNNGWQGHSIEQVESLASQVVSPTSSTSTIHARNRASASPRVAIAPNKIGYASVATSPAVQLPQSNRGYDSVWKDTAGRPRSSTSPGGAQVSSLAPPASIRAGEHSYINPRRNSNARCTPAYISHPSLASPHTPAQPSPLQSTPGQPSLRTPQLDPIIFSPHQNFREQEALETLVFMSSPGNSANMKHNFPTGQASQGKPGARTALPTSRLGPGVENHVNGRKSLPSGRPQQYHGSQAKHVGFVKSPSAASAMDVDDPQASPQYRGMPRRRTVGSGPRPSLSTPAGLGGASRSRPALQDEDIERMLDQVGADSSDSEGEISLPHGRPRQGAAGVGA